MNLKEEFHLSEKQHAHTVERARKESSCDECLNSIPLKSFAINYVEEVNTQYGRTFENKRFCSRVCFMRFLKGKALVYNG